MKKEGGDIYERVTRQIVEAIEHGPGRFRLPWHRAAERGGASNKRRLEKHLPGRKHAPPVGEPAGERLPLAPLGDLPAVAVPRGPGQAGREGGERRLLEREGGRGEEEDEGGARRNPGGSSRPTTRSLTPTRSITSCRKVPPELSAEERNAHADEVLCRPCADIRHGGTVAAYNVTKDCILLPRFELFRDGDAYYATLAHEVTHWTGAKTRLDRPFAKDADSEEYAFEELIADLGAAFLAAHLKLSSEPKPEHAAYLATWLRRLKDDKRAIFAAASKAQAAADYVTELAAKRNAA